MVMLLFAKLFLCLNLEKNIYTVKCNAQNNKRKCWYFTKLT